MRWTDSQRILPKPLQNYVKTNPRYVNEFLSFDPAAGQLSDFGFKKKFALHSAICVVRVQFAASEREIALSAHGGNLGTWPKNALCADVISWMPDRRQT